MIRVGVDVWNLPADRRGIGRYVRSILDAWAKHAPERIAVTLVIPERFTAFAAQQYRDELSDGNGYAVCSRSALGRTKLDALWFPFNGVSWSDNFRGPAIATLHDASTFVQPGYGDAARAPFIAASKRCVALITDSHFSAIELARELAISRERLTPIPLGVAPTRQPAASPAIDPQLYAPFILYVGGSEPRKNLHSLFGAMRHLRARFPRLGLVLIGPMPFTVGSEPGVRIAALGRVDEATLDAFFAACTAFVYPSTYEGFGLPILEAMNQGAPVIAARSSALAEAGGDAASYVEPFDEVGYADAVTRVIEGAEFAQQLRARGRARAALMTWERTAQATLAVIENVLAAG